MVVARLIYFLHPLHEVKRIPARWLAKAFVTADIVCFIVQAAGGGMLANPDDPDIAKTGRNIYMVGVGIQLAFVMVFLGLTVTFHRDLAYNTRAGIVKLTSRWTKALLWVVYAVLLLIVVRLVFLLHEFPR